MPIMLIIKRDTRDVYEKELLREKRGVKSGEVKMKHIHTQPLIAHMTT